MTKAQIVPTPLNFLRRKSDKEFHIISDQILNYANKSIPRVEFLNHILKILKDYCGCDAIELRLKENEKYDFCEATDDPKLTFFFKKLSCLRAKDGNLIPCQNVNSIQERICKIVLLSAIDASPPFFTNKGSFYSGNPEIAQKFIVNIDKDRKTYKENPFGIYKSFAAIPLYIGNEHIGLLLLKSKKKNFFNKSKIELYEDLSQILGIASVNQRAQAALRERIKELNCLYELSRIATDPNISLESIFQKSIELIPPAWQYPEITCARLNFEGQELKTNNFKGTKWKQRAEIKVDGKKLGFCEVYYLEEKPEIDEGPFLKEERALLNTIVAMLGSIVEHKQADKALRESEHALRERVKELSCLYNVAKFAQQPGISLVEILEGIVKLLPPAWQYPQITASRIFLDDRVYMTAAFKNVKHKQSADIVVNGEKRGSVEVGYTKEKPLLDEGPFLKEERSLIEAIAKQVALIVETREAEEEKSRLQEQIRHADRLATIGQLASGVAHELNEPLANILGFAQLIKKSPNVTKQIEEDVKKILNASLYAREIIKKLMLFARQTPPKKTIINLNQIVEEGLSFFESRASKEGIKIVRLLSSKLPEVIADPAQFTQVLVNLVVNAIQAMEEGGTLTIKTIAYENYVSLIVEDTGVGMSEEVRKKVFLPFYTTKEVGRGTGLGLAVVHGIVTSHGGTIKVDSKLGEGTRFEIKFPLTRMEQSSRET